VPVNVEPRGELDWPRHGGALAAAAARYRIPVASWLDLSTGINPEPYPAPQIGGRLFSRLPDRAKIDELLAAARRAYRIPRGAAIVAVPGTEAAIHLAPYLAPPGPVVIFGPTYGSHEEAWEDAGRRVVIAEAGAPIPADVASAVIGNPNNPDGRLVTPAALAALAERLAGRGGMLVVDEAFADTQPDVSLCPVLDRVPALVLRSFGKFFGLPGLRLGFVAGPRQLVVPLGRMYGDWPVSNAAIEIGTRALTDFRWRETARERLAADAYRLRELLDRRGLDVIGGTDLFVLVEHDNALVIHRGLARRAILTRVFRQRPNWIRFGIPRTDGFDRLEQALAEVTR
jgi:cobalamin biosynthetic protein CobC